jgi:hypothetical protein
MSTIKDFRDQNGGLLAHAAIPDDYLIGGSLVNQRQHEGVPFFITCHAINAAKNIMIFGLSDERFTTYKNQMIRMTLNSMADVKWNSIRDFTEPMDYLRQFAEALSQMRLVPTADADLPSVCGQNQQQAYRDFMAEYEAAFQRDEQLGTPTKANNSVFRSVMRRYEGTAASGAPCAVIAGMDYYGIEYYSTASILGVLNPLAGLLGGAFKNRQAEKSSKEFGHGTPCDAIDWGAKYKFLMVAPKEYEGEATEAFLEFVQTFHMDRELSRQFCELNAQRVQMRLQETMQFQAMAQQSMLNLQRSQQQLQQTLASNSAAMSDMIMDSWNRKMASDSRISQARSEAVMGGDTYVNSYGQNYRVDVTADHVYQNQYGDVFGVSGTAPDQSTLNRLNWRELGK